MAKALRIGGLPAAADRAGSNRRRRPPSKAEQKRREQWGQTWGPLLRATAKHLRTKGF